MSSFISETLDAILQEQTDCKNTVLILPSQRAGVFVKNSLKSKISQGFLPEIIHIEKFIEQISGCKKIDQIELLFYFYGIYKEIESNPDSFDVFSSWAITALLDFNEIDQYLVDTNDLFVYVRDIQRLRKWSVKGTFQETELVKDHYAFMERLGEFYTVFYNFLSSKKIGYQGLLYRESVKQTSQFLNQNGEKRYVFIGFNALNKAEEQIIQQFLSNGNASIYWDIDESFVKQKHQAARFINQYLSNWKYYEQSPKPIFKSNFNSNKHIEVIGTSKNVTQLKIAGNILSERPKLQNTALVLSDESLLSAALSAIPLNNEGINITMGYQLKNIPNNHFIEAYFRLFLSQKRLQKQDQNEFYYKDVLRFIKSPSFNGIEKQPFQQLEQTILENNLSFVSFQTIKSCFAETTSNQTLLSLFKPLNSSIEFISRVISLISLLKENVSDLEKEYLFRFYNTFIQLQNLETTYHYFTDLTTLYKFFKQIINSETLSFQGEPLKGLQLMGMLETRVLDFETVIITSVNEGILPNNANTNSYIPFDVKVQFGLPTYKEKDAIFSYHFFRLLQRAKNIYLIHNTESDHYGNGEKSRFISQLELLRDDIQHKQVSPKVEKTEKRLLVIEKNLELVEKLKNIAANGFSPSFFGKYLLNPIDFYQQYILNIGDTKSVEETVAANTMGTIIHNALEELYTPYIGKLLSSDDITSMKSQVVEEVENQFKKEFKQGNYQTGKNKLIYEVSIHYINRLLAIDQKEIEGRNELKIVMLEKTLKAPIFKDKYPFPLFIKGKVDRIDQLNGVTRIIDYKTGKVTSSELKLTDFSELKDCKYSKAIQLMLYASMYTSTFPEQTTPIEVGIFSFKNLNEGLLKMNFSSNYRNKDHQVTPEKIDAFLQGFEPIVEELLNVSIPFEEPQEILFKN